MPGRRVTLMLTVLVICYTSDYVHCRHVACVNQSECIARSCLQCANVDADCQFDNVTNSLHCQPADLAQCNLTECDPVECQHCQGLLFRHDQEWKLKSHCASFDDSACVLGLITDQCVVNNTVTDASVIVARVEGEREFLSVCNCVEENCTQEFVVNYFITPEEIPTPTDSADDECTDSNGGCEHQCTNVDGGYECSCNEGFILSSDGRSCSGSSSRSYSVVIGILCGLVVIGIITAVTIIWIVRRRKNSGGSEHSPPIILTSNEAYVPTGPHA